MPGEPYILIYQYVGQVQERPQQNQCISNVVIEKASLK